MYSFDKYVIHFFFCVYDVPLPLITSSHLKHNLKVIFQRNVYKMTKLDSMIQVHKIRKITKFILIYLYVVFKSKEMQHLHCLI